MDEKFDPLKGQTEGGPTSPGPVVDLADVDNLLKELDPEFNTQLGTINSELGQLGQMTGLESVNLSADYLKESTDGKSDEAISEPAKEEKTKPAVSEAPKGEKTEGLFQAIGVLLKATGKVFINIAFKLVKLPIAMRKETPKEVLRATLDDLLGPLREWLTAGQGLLAKLSEFSLKSYIKLALIIAVAFVLKYVVTDMSHHLKPDVEKDPFLSSWDSVADSVHIVPADEDENIENPLKHPEYTVLVHRIIANLKPLSKRSAPMVTAELYLEASNQDAAIEIHERELEVRDSLSRIFEETTFDELDTRDGKERLKARIRTELNHFLNKGHVKRIFYSSLNMVP